jgi:hypothetical protein
LFGSSPSRQWRSTSARPFVYSRDITPRYSVCSFNFLLLCSLLFINLLLTDWLGQLTNDVEEDAMQDEDGTMQVVKRAELAFGKDLRLLEVRRLLRSNRIVSVSLPKEQLQNLVRFFSFSFVNFSNFSLDRSFIINHSVVASSA